jgi:hypothetical protein
MPIVSEAATLDTAIAGVTAAVARTPAAALMPTKPRRAASLLGMRDEGK